MSLSSKEISIKEKSETLLRHYNITLCNSFPLAECIVKSACNSFLLTGHNDGTIQKWEINSPGENCIVASHSLKILCLCLSEFILASSGQDRKLKIFKVPEYQLLYEYSFQATCLKFLFSPYECLATSTSDYYLKINTKKPEKVDFSNKLPESSVTCLELLHTSSSIFIGFESGIGQVYSVDSMKQLNIDLIHSNSVMCACEYEDKIITACMNKFISLWSQLTHELISVLETGNEIFISLEVFRGYLVVTPMKRVVSLVRLDSFKVEKEFDLEENLKCSVLVGNWLVYSGNHRNLRMFDLVKQEKAEVLTGHKSNVVCLALKAEENLIATGGRDNTIRVWDLVAGKQVHILYGHKSLVRYVCFINAILVSVSDDKSLKLWDYNNEVLINSIPVMNVHLKVPHNIGFYQDYFAVILTSFSYKVWKIDDLSVSNSISRKFIFLLAYRKKLKIK